MALPDFTQFKAPYRFVAEGRAFRLYEKGVKTNTTFKNMVEAKKKVLALNNAWRASPAGRKASPKKKYDATGHIVQKPVRRTTRTNPFFGMFAKSKKMYEVSTNGDYPQRKRTEIVNGDDLYNYLLDLGLRDDYARTAIERANIEDEDLVGTARTRGGYGELVEVRRLRSNPDKYGFDSAPHEAFDRASARADRREAEATLQKLLRSRVSWKRELGEQVRDGVLSMDSMAEILDMREGISPGARQLIESVRPGYSVTIITPLGQALMGRAMLKGPAGWVLNVRGRPGMTAIASEDNIVKVVKARR